MKSSPVLNVYQPSMYVLRSISSGSSVMFTSNHSCTSFKIFASVSSATNIIPNNLIELKSIQKFKELSILFILLDLKVMLLQTM